MSVVKNRSRLLRQVVEVPSPETFKVRVNRALNKLILMKLSLLVEEHLD